MTRLASLLLAVAIAAPSAAVAEPIIRGDVQVHVDLPRVIIRDRDRTPPRGFIRFDDYDDRYDRAARWRGTYDVTGTYDSNFGRVYLDQDGARVTGRFESDRGEGRIKGIIRNNVLYFRWREGGAEGKGRWFLKDGRQRVFEGTWGTWESRDNAGRWNLQRIGVGTRDRYDRHDRRYNDRRYRRY